MNKIITALITGIALASFGAQAFAATTATLSSSRSTIPVGQTFTVGVTIDPQGQANYAEKIEVKFPADVLEVRSFTFAPSWMPLTQTGYDETNNVSGTLMKSAGYPSGFTSATFYGTIIFYAKKAGTASVTLGSNSAAFNANGQTLLNGQALAITVGAAPVAPVVTPTVTQAVSVTPAPSASVSSDVTASPTAVAASADASTSSGMSALWVSLIAVLVVIVIAVAVYYFTPRKKRKSRRI